MKLLTIAANWKSNMTKNEANEWLLEFSKEKIADTLEVVIFTPFTLLDFVSDFAKENKLRIKVGAENVSQFDEGSYTGEVNAVQIKEFADYVLIGHSERRSSFNESNAAVLKKVEEASQAGLKLIVCVSDLAQLEGIGENENLIIAYEPIDAIGTNNPQDPQKTQEMASLIKEKTNTRVLYGGSVNAQNAKNYTELTSIDGLLIGSASLDVKVFLKILNNVS